MAAPFISVIINTYNYGRFIEETIESALAQDYPAERMEIIVVDDGSTDDTSERVKKYEGRVRYFRTENGDQCSAVTFGVGQAKGNLLALLDGDDLWLPNKLSRVAEEFAKDPRTVMVYHKYVFWDGANSWGPERFAEVSGDVLADRRKLIAYSAAPTSSLVFRRDAFEPLTRIPLKPGFMYDTFLFTAVLFLGPVACIPEVLAKNRVHGKNRWAAGQAGPDEEKARRRIARRQSTIEVLRDWISANAPESARPQARILLQRSLLIQQAHELRLNPSRMRAFAHQLRYNRMYGPIMPPRELAYQWVYAVGLLVLGEHAHYLEGVRTRLNRLLQHFRNDATADQHRQPV